MFNETLSENEDKQKMRKRIVIHGEKRNSTLIEVKLIKN